MGLLQAAVFVPAPAGLFLPPTAAFFTVVTACVMQSMTVVMVPMPRRKTCFPIGIGDCTAKAKPPAVPTAFCVYFIPFGDEQMKSHSGRPAISSNSAGVAISQPRVEGRSSSTLGKEIKRDGNSVGVAISRRRYPQQDNGLK